MKFFLTLTLFVLPLSCFSSVITFECHSKEVVGHHKFEARGIVTIDDYNKVDGIISLQVEKAQAPGSMQVFEELKVEGVHRHFAEGEITNYSFEQFNLTTNDKYIKSLNLLVDLKLENTSQVSSIDNFLYRSSCRASK